MTTTPVRTIDQLLDDARRHLRRVGPREAFAAQQRGAVLVDIRPQVSRDSEGRLPGALVVDRNVLEWRVGPAAAKPPPPPAPPPPNIPLCHEGAAPRPPPPTPPARG